MSTAEQSSAWFIPQTTIGKTLLAAYLLSLIAISLPLYGVVFNEPELLGPLPETATWTYLWYGVINLVLLGTYYGLFKPWADQATQYLDEWDQTSATESVDETPPAATQSSEGGDD